MNRLELEQVIKDEGKKRKIILESCQIYDRGNYLEFYPTLVNEYKKDWVYSYDVEKLIHDFAPIEREHKIDKTHIANRKFVIGQKVQVDDLWIKIKYGEKNPKCIDVRSVCGQWLSGWVEGRVVETPEQNDRAVVVIFDRDIWYEEKHEWWGCVDGIEKAIKDNKIIKVEKDSPLFVGSCVWNLRKL